MVKKVDCEICATALSGRQRKYCSRKCKNKDTNHHHQSYVAQQARGIKRKSALIADAGGACVRCGYHRNQAALAWHHVRPADKKFELDMRSLSNRSDWEIREEVKKCLLLCANCHAEEHSPQFMTSTLLLKPARSSRVPTNSSGRRGLRPKPLLG